MRRGAGLPARASAPGSLEVKLTCGIDVSLSVRGDGDDAVLSFTYHSEQLGAKVVGELCAAKLLAAMNERPLRAVQINRSAFPHYLPASALALCCAWLDTNGREHWRQGDLELAVKAGLHSAPRASLHAGAPAARFPRGLLVRLPDGREGTLVTLPLESGHVSVMSAEFPAEVVHQDALSAA